MIYVYDLIHNFVRAYIVVREQLMIDLLTYNNQQSMNYSHINYFNLDVSCYHYEMFII